LLKLAGEPRPDRTCAEFVLMSALERVKGIEPSS
jgi:hypothetical protein